MLLRSALLFPSFVIRPADGDVIFGSTGKHRLDFLYQCGGKRQHDTFKGDACRGGRGRSLHSLSTGVAIYYDLSQDLAFWYAGGVSGIKWAHLQVLVPVIAVFIILATFMGRSVTLLSMGNDVAANLG